MKPLTIGKVANLAGVGIETIRFYELKGLIPKPPRKESGYRQYPQDTVSRIRFIKRAQELGFSLKEINDLLSLKLDSTATCNDVKRQAVIKITDIEEKILHLQKMKKALVKLTAACSGRGPVDDCPILEALK